MAQTQVILARARGGKALLAEVQRLNAGEDDQGEDTHTGPVRSKKLNRVISPEVTALP
jgi:hypothetical protein